MRNPTLIALTGPAVQHPDGGYTRAQGVRGEALPRGMFQQRGAVLLLCKQRSGGGKLTIDLPPFRPCDMHLESRDARRR